MGIKKEEPTGKDRGLKKRQNSIINRRKLTDDSVEINNDSQNIVLRLSKAKGGMQAWTA